MSSEAPDLCSRCLKILAAGRGQFYVVSIEAVADPTPPSFTSEEMDRDYRADWRATVAELEGTSPQEALDQVYRRVVIHLCNACYQDWIENPAG
jgi:hypothetical protein